MTLKSIYIIINTKGGVNTSTFYLTVAISGAGKTYWAHKSARPYDVILDSDEIREEVYGDANCQDNPEKIFNIMFQRTRAALKGNRDVYYVATNLNCRRRINLLKSLKHLFPETKYICIYINCPIELARERNFSRSRTVPSYVIDRQIRSIQIPWYGEGWDEIKVINNWENDKEDMWVKQRKEITARVIEYGSQKNSHHNLELYEHCKLAEKIAYDNHFSSEVIAAALLHDYGKAWTGILWEKDNYTETHYPNHENVSAVLALNMGYSLKVAALVCYHMTFYQDATTQKRWREKLGEDLWKELEQLHYCDESSH